mmetsp:Transcript_11710/g.19067  ORF Transcript_11710/g.19067 Transcript_11710/m.19067 type:complete len:453 (+) Transcript_11710:300-1658(+)|eukprot:CAMPEP_0203800648 /NCGR_PEP_ID=MMETSP0100_2-20121128/10709_1 /ASSEMBLY_ACC=CAM_ASM_000210 /TAXON_ID=96639 /ORGANISM=" , Strain NY0313808BC1" /LENGTH=452 /DNA_ID=CAMNT_0050706905 /DNA_START=247 /DNA_END=1605 /DNA_ORIENTATION=-
MNATAVDTISDRDFALDGIPNFLEMINFYIVFLAGTLAGAAGVGGGAIYVPLYIVLFGLVYEAIPLSKAAVFGAAIAFFIGNIVTPVPKSTKHVNRFAYDAIMVMEPSTLLGTVFGVLASRVTPYWLITLLMALLLAFSATKTFLKGNKLFRKETETIVRRQSSEENLSSSVSTGLVSNGSQSNSYYATDILSDGPNRVLIDDAYPSDWLGLRCGVTVGICFFTVLAAAIVADDQIMPAYTRVDCGSIEFWGLIVLNTLIIGGVTVWNVTFLMNNSERLSHQCAVFWSHEAGIKYSVLCLAAGFMSALCGIGGSTIKGPILLEMGLHPTLSKATSQLMLLSTVSSSAFQFYLSGELPPVYGMIFFTIGILGGYTGKWLVDKYVEWDGRQSTIVYLLAWYIVVAAVIMTSIGIIIVLGQFSPTINWEQLWFRGVCDELPQDMAALKWLSKFES